MFNELSFNFDLTHSLKLRYFYNCIPIQTDPCQDIIKFKSYMLWFCFCFFNMYKKQLHMKARLRKDQMCFSSSSKSCKKKLGLCPKRAWLGNPPPLPPAKSCKQNSLERLHIECHLQRLGQVAGALRARRARHQADTQVRALLYLGCVRDYIRLRLLLYQVPCTTILCCVRHPCACTTVL